MKIAIIADDLTGANDTGVQFAKKGLRTSVLMQQELNDTSDLDVLIIDTDSRSQTPQNAYNRVFNASRELNENLFDIIYKKIDSTMRGNIGSELDAIYDVFEPDMLFIAPGYPENNRFIKEGKLYIGEVPLEDTNFALDPTNPMKNSYIPTILKLGTKRDIGLITLDDYHKGMEYVLEKIMHLKSRNIPYVLFDSSTEEDLEFIVKCAQQIRLNVVWSGSAGLADYLIPNTSQTIENFLPESNKVPVLMVVGSVNEKSRTQLHNILEVDGITGVELQSQLVVKTEKMLINEKQRILDEIKEAYQKNLHVVLYSSGDPESIELAIQCGENNELTPEMVSNRISQVLGEITKEVVREYRINRLFLTGGDTAKRVCDAMGITEFRLIDEVEIGVPIGFLEDEENIITITKAGGFGSDEVLLKSLKVLRGEPI